MKELKIDNLGEILPLFLNSGRVEITHLSLGGGAIEDVPYYIDAMLYTPPKDGMLQYALDVSLRLQDGKLLHEKSYGYIWYGEEQVEIADELLESVLEIVRSVITHVLGIK
jgi:hypothetical protein